MKILADHRWRGSHGIGRYADAILSSIETTPLDSKGSPSSPLDLFYLNQQIKKYTPDVFYSPGYNAPFSFNCLNFFNQTKIPYIFTVHDLMHIDIKEERKLLTTIYYHLVLKQALRKAYKVMTVSEYSKSRIMEFSGIAEDKITVTYSGIDLEKFSRDNRSPYRHHRPYFFYSGNHKPHKNLSRLIQAFKQIQKIEKIDLILTGDPEKKLQALVNSLNLQSQVIFTGRISDQKLAEYYQGAQAVAVPSTCEGFGLPALEGLASGRVVVTSNITAIPEVVGDQAILINPFDIDSIAHGLEQALDNHLYTPEKIRARVEQARFFSWNKVIDCVRMDLGDAIWSG